MNNFIPHHINATSQDLSGNNGIGRYILLPGSDGRAKALAQNFDNLTVKTHPRGHHLYLGTIHHQGHDIDMAAISTGMGCPSLEIVLHELFSLGGKRFLRVGTAGSLQPNMVRIGDIINAQASVRDECTTLHYVPIALPAIASFDTTMAIKTAAKKIGLTDQLHTGVVHCKSSLYAREFGAGPKAAKNKDYIDLLSNCGVLATEMETSALFIQSQLYNYQLMKAHQKPQNRVLAGAILGILIVPPDQYASASQEIAITENLSRLAIETIKVLSMRELSVCDAEQSEHDEVIPA